jgi:hypothetical protein
MPADEMTQIFTEESLPDAIDVQAGDFVVPMPRRPRPQEDSKRIKKGDPSMTLHVSKLRGISFDVRAKLKRNGVTYTHQLLAAAGSPKARHLFAEKSGIEEPTLERLTCRADLARIKGIGAIFADMLELLGGDCVITLAEQDPTELHGTLYKLNSAERFARRAPTPEEVIDWVEQGKLLPKLVSQRQ